MSEISERSAGKRHIRNGLRSKWSSSDFSAIASDEALERLAEARNKSSRTANTFMLFAASVSFLYFLKLEGLASDFSVGQYRLADLPFGLFVLCVTALALSSVALIRMGDSRGFDRMLRLACEHRHDADCELRYLAFPNENGWGEPFSQIAHVIAAGAFVKVIRFVGFFLVNLFLLGLLVAPLATGADFLLCSRVLESVQFVDFRQYSVVLVSASNCALLFLLFWVRLVDRG